MKMLEPPPITGNLLAFFANRDQADRERNGYSDDDVWPEGERHRRLVSVAGSLRRAGCNGDEIEAALLLRNRRCCRPPMHEQEVRDLAQDIAERYPPGADELIGAIHFGDLPTDENGEPLPADQYVWLDEDGIDALPPTVYLIEGLLPERSLGETYGKRSAGKTFDAFDMALSLATGKDYHDHKVNKQCTVAYVMAEGVGGARKRKDAWKKHHELEIPKTNFFLLPRSIRLTDTAKLFALVESLKRLPCLPDVLFIDTLARSIAGKDENSNADMQQIVAALDYIRETIGCAVHVIHHAGWNDSHERGASSLGDSCETIIALRKDDDSQVVTWKVEKTKDGELPRPRALVLQPVILTDSCVLVDADVGAFASDKKASVPDLVEWIEAQYVAKLADLRNEFPMADGTWKLRREALEMLGYRFIEERVGRSHWIRIYPPFSQ